MTIRFVTLDGEQVETHSVERLFEAANEGKITPTTIIEVDGKRVPAGKIKNLFPNLDALIAGESEANKIQTAAWILFAFIIIDATGWIAYGAYLASELPQAGLTVIARTIFKSAGLLTFWYIFKHMATKICK